MTMNSTQTIMMQWNEATQAVEQANSILVVTHVFPDGDAIGSLAGLTAALRARGKSVDAVVDGGVLDSLGFVPGTGDVLSQLDNGDWDLMISVDASDEERTGLAGVYGRAHSQRVINLDHHPTNTMFGDFFLVQPDAVSATEIVYDWLVFMKQPISREIAVPLLTGLVTDTLGFRTSNVTARTLEIAQRLMEAGASLTEITARTLGSKSYNVVQLWKQVLPSVKMQGGIISAEITQADLKAARLSDVSDGGLVGFLVKVNEAMIAVVFKETPEGKIELSFRSKLGFDVSQVALNLGGGGHKQASGATIDGPLDTARKRVMTMLRKAARQGKLEIV
jgi:phosphoesterase RecJ-like protein